MGSMRPKPHLLMNALFLRWCLVVLLLALVGPSSARIIRVEEAPFPLEGGVTLIFDTHQYHGIKDIYTTWIRVEEVFGAAVLFEWAMYGYQQPQTGAGPSRGTSTVEDIEGCSYLDPWWPGQVMPPGKRCELWVSREVYRDLKDLGKALFQPDWYVRQDQGVVLEVVEKSVYRVEIDGRMRALPALKVSSSKGDVLWIYDNAENPFVLKALLPNIYEWEVTHIYLDDTGPQPPGF